jgi:hypothetical protein
MREAEPQAAAAADQDAIPDVPRRESATADVGRGPILPEAVHWENAR